MPDDGERKRETSPAGTGLRRQDPTKYSSIHSLPSELLSCVFSYLSCQEATKYKAVCSTWAGGLLSHQYRRVTLDSLEACRLFLDVISQIPERIPLVRELAILQKDYGWLFDQYELHPRILDFVSQAENINQFAFDSALRGPGSFSYDATCSPPFFILRLGAIVGKRITYVHGDTAFPHHAHNKTPWWANRSSTSAMEYPLRAAESFHRAFSHAERMAFLFDKEWLVGHPSVCATLSLMSPSVKKLALDFCDNREKIAAFVLAVPDTVEYIHLRQTMWRLGALGPLARKGRTIEINVPPVSTVNDIWHQWVEDYTWSLQTSSKGSVLRVLGHNDVFHERMLSTSRESGAFSAVHKVLSNERHDLPFTLV
ncbi:hypothetical protein DFJ77DRAFT_446359 [Powellomyces hirtus]|nr:hypothetical protein DFJ77DRAFT_446359 [Powellomyces hirtus]